MKRTFLILSMLALATFGFTSTGCDDGSTATDGNTSGAHDHDDHDGHDHAAHDHAAPHGGHLIELGRNHEYHAELVDDHKTDTATIYMLDDHMAAMKHDAESVTLVLTAGDITQTFELKAKPDSTGEFTSTEPELFKLLDAEGVKGKLRTSIDGKPFSGAFEHHAHDHSAHDHDDHAGHDHDGDSHAEDHDKSKGHDKDDGHAHDHK